MMETKTRIQTHTHKKPVIIIAFPWQQWLCERVLILRCTYVTSVVKYANDRLIPSNILPFDCMLSKMMPSS
jgi:hypothetical protein